MSVVRLANTPRPKLNRAAYHASLTTGHALCLSMVPILVPLFVRGKHHASNAQRVAREIMAETAISAHRGHIMQTLEVLVKLAQRVSIKRSMAKVNVSLALGENTTTKLEALDPV